MKKSLILISLLALAGCSESGYLNEVPEKSKPADVLESNQALEAPVFNVDYYFEEGEYGDLRTGGEVVSESEAIQFALDYAWRFPQEDFNEREISVAYLSALGDIQPASWWLEVATPGFPAGQGPSDFTILICPYTAKLQGFTNNLVQSRLWDEKPKEILDLTPYKLAASAFSQLALGEIDFEIELLGSADKPNERVVLEFLVTTVYGVPYLLVLDVNENELLSFHQTRGNRSEMSMEGDGINELD